MGERLRNLKNKNLLKGVAVLGIGAAALSACGGETTSAVSPTETVTVTAPANPGHTETSKPTKTETSKPTATKTETEKPSNKTEIKVTPDVRKALDMPYDKYVNEASPDLQKKLLAELVPEDKLAAWAKSDYATNLGLGWTKPSLTNTPSQINQNNYTQTAYIYTHINGGYVNAVGAESGNETGPLQSDLLDIDAAQKALAGEFIATSVKYTGGGDLRSNAGTASFNGWKNAVTGQVFMKSMKENFVPNNLTYGDTDTSGLDFNQGDAFGEYPCRALNDVSYDDPGQLTGNDFLYVKDAYGKSGGNWVIYRVNPAGVPHI